MQMITLCIDNVPCSPCSSIPFDIVLFINPLMVYDISHFIMLSMIWVVVPITMFIYVLFFVKLSVLTIHLVFMCMMIIVFFLLVFPSLLTCLSRLLCPWLSRFGMQIHLQEWKVEMFLPIFFPPVILSSCPVLPFNSFFLMFPPSIVCLLHVLLSLCDFSYLINLLIFSCIHCGVRRLLLSIILHHIKLILIPSFFFLFISVIFPFAGFLSSVPYSYYNIQPMIAGHVSILLFIHCIVFQFHYLYHCTSCAISYFLTCHNK